jgi:hypothetical protein
MPKLTSEQSKSINVVVGAKVRKLLDEMARERTQQRRLEGQSGTVYASDIVREALQVYLRKLGKAVAVEVDRGGYRGGKMEDDDRLGGRGYPVTPEEWKQAEREADEDIAAGRVETFDTMEAFLADLMNGTSE